MSITVLALTTTVPASARPVPSPGFAALFDGKTPKRWRGDKSIWSEKDGAINGGSDKPIPQDTFLISDASYGNFELRYRYRWLSYQGNSGFMFRSAQVDGNFAMTGYQANVVLTNERQERFGMLYDGRFDRQEMALLGQKAVISRRAAGGGGRGRLVHTAEATVNSRADIIGSVKAAASGSKSS
ncbi:MAG: DUF1080 domain-containing protein [Sphingomonadaceae bacterium]|nr:DUF1080 domain-containing protein [Sphingomonadaceae bacterium]